jgi:hypothetical protein
VFKWNERSTLHLINIKNTFKMKKILFMTLSIALAITMNSCNDTAGTSNYPVKVSMTDAPGPYSKVNIDIQSVEVTGGDGKTVVLNTTAGIYNLLDFTNGVNVLLATSVLQDAKVSQIRLILGTNNTIVLNGITYPLSTPSADQSGLKLQIKQDLVADIDNAILIDFDANKSIVETGNGTYKLKPVLRTIVTAVSGTIRGTVTPVGALAVVSATSAATGEVNTSSADAFGNFKIVGLPAGIYSFTITPVLPLLPVTVSNVVVQVGVNTSVGAFAF